MSLTSEQIDKLRAYAADRKGELAKLINDAADTIELLSAKLHASQMERSSQYYHGGCIPVSERLPECEQEVLVTRHFLSDNQLKKNAIAESFYVEAASRMDDEWTSYSDEYKIKRHLHKVIAWMPLPEPYREEE